jgi:Flp pilus assembly protein TadG
MLDRFLAWLEPRASCHRRSAVASAGSAAVEFAITAPILVALAIGAADYGTLVNQQAILEAATRAGAEYGRAHPNDPNTTKTTVTGFTTFSPAAAASVSTVCTCTDNTTVACPGAGPNPCAAKADPRLIEYVSVTATQTFTPMLAYASFAFPAQLSAGTMTRTQ